MACTGDQDHVDEPIPTNQRFDELRDKLLALESYEADAMEQLNESERDSILTMRADIKTLNWGDLVAKYGIKDKDTAAFLDELQVTVEILDAYRIINNQSDSVNIRLEYATDSAGNEPFQFKSVITEPAGNNE